MSRMLLVSSAGNDRVSPVDGARVESWIFQEALLGRGPVAVNVLPGLGITVADLDGRYADNRSVLVMQL